MNPLLRISLLGLILFLSTAGFAQTPFTATVNSIADVAFQRLEREINREAKSAGGIVGVWAILYVQQVFEPIFHVTEHLGTIQRSFAAGPVFLTTKSCDPAGGRSTDSGRGTGAILPVTVFQSSAAPPSTAAVAFTGARPELAKNTDDHIGLEGT
jgi:hypothetical protein